MSPSTATVRRPPATLDEVRERRAHRDRVRVPGVVDQHAAAGQRQLLVRASRANSTSSRAGGLEAERVERPRARSARSRPGAAR